MRRPLPRRLRARLPKRLRTDQSGMALIEFAITLPILLSLYLLGAQLSNAIACSRKVTVATRETADLVTRYARLTAAQVDTILGASSQIMTPFPAGDAVVRISQVRVRQDNTVYIEWSRARNGAALEKGAAYTDLPTSMQTPGSTYIMAEVSYLWTPTVPFGDLTAKTLSDKFYMLPRLSSSVTCNDC